MKDRSKEIALRLVPNNENRHDRLIIISVVLVWALILLLDIPAVEKGFLITLAYFVAIRLDEKFFLIGGVLIGASLPLASRLENTDLYDALELTTVFMLIIGVLLSLVNANHYSLIESTRPRSKQKTFRWKSQEEAEEEE